MKAHPWRVAIALCVLIPLGAILAFALSPTQPEYVTAAAERGDIRQTVEAVGTVISDRDLSLQFPTSGILAQVYVKEGDRVKAGQKLAALKAGNLAADVASASARLAVAQASLQELQEGARPEDIAIAEAEVESKRAALDAAHTALSNAETNLERSQEKLDALESEAKVSLAGTVSNVGSTVSQELTTAANGLSAVRDVLSNNDVVDAIIKYSSADYDAIVASIASADQAITAMLRSSTGVTEFQNALTLLDRSRAAATDVWTIINRSFDLIAKLPATVYFDESDRESYKADLATERSTLQTTLGDLDAASKNLRDASAAFTTKIAAEESSLASARGAKEKALSDIATYDASLRIAEAQLQLKKAPARTTDLNSALADVRQASASLQRAQAEYSNTIIVAPIAGTVTKVHVKVGEITPAGAAITLLGESPYRVEMFVSEIDISKVQLSQTGSIELDAFRNVELALTVSEIDEAPTDRDGVSKYRVRLDFIKPPEGLKIGMTGDASIVTGMRSDVVTVPVRSVVERDDGTLFVRVLDDSGVPEDRTVIKGMEGEGGLVEVTGVEEGETVIVLEKK